MGLLIDTDVFVLAERAGKAINFDIWKQYGSAYISSITVSELLVGVYRANTPTRRRSREAFVEAIIANIPALAFSSESARVHARMLADLPASITIGAHDALIAAQALEHGHAVLTNNARDFERLPRVEVVRFESESLK
ncbi:MAG: PIN domain-containing protein [Burkholderiales bacterium]